MNPQELLRHCDNVLPGHAPWSSLKSRLTDLAAAMDGSEDQDVYGSGELIAAFESELAERFGKEAALFMPSGTMAQQIALRIWCDRRRDPTVAMHPSAHLEFAEQLGYQFLHGIHRLQFGGPEFIGDRPFTVADLDALGRVPGCVLLELPYRPLGGVLPSRDSVAELCEWARRRQVPLHLDGARIWQVADAWDCSHAEIAAGFDSLYVSFYKDVGALCGAALIGDAAFIAEARPWLRRHGGNLYTQAPFVVSARQRLAASLPRMGAWNARARAVAAALTGHPKVRVHPDPPDVNFFALHLEGDAETLLARHHALAAETGTWLFGGLRPGGTPGFCRTEVHCWENAEAFDLARLPDFLARLFED